MKWIPAAALALALLPASAHAAADSAAVSVPPPAAADSARAAAVPAPPSLVPEAHRRFWATPEAEGGFLAQDKLLHASVSYSAAVTLRMAGASKTASLLSAAALGLGKEAHDWLLRDAGSPAQGASRRDLLADAAGVLLAGLAIHFWMR